ncbi:hypothetical protein [Sphingomonas endophytica]|uniref:hypothetical protein n=1 Tax=Sphingomonas endophytica TaxID=869719 RepID=UPI0007370FE7|nr:hypothetical protein [Sphingomonas endophytica]
MTGRDVSLAQAHALAARERLNGTAQRLQHQLEPHRLARNALDQITDGGEQLARAGADAARRNPATIAGAATVLVVLLARKRIGRLLGAAKPPVAQKSALPAERIGS